MSAVRRVLIADNDRDTGFSIGVELSAGDLGDDGYAPEAEFEDVALMNAFLGLLDQGGWEPATMAAALGMSVSDLDAFAVELGVEQDELYSDWSKGPLVASSDPLKSSLLNELAPLGLGIDGMTDPQDYRDRIAGDAADQFLAEHDPRLHLHGVEAEVAEALADAGLTLDDAKSAFRKTGGRPSADLVKLRRRISDALRPAWDEGRSRNYLSEALDVDRKTLRLLMCKPPHGG